MNSFFHAWNHNHQVNRCFYFKQWILIQYEIVFFNRNIEIMTMAISFIWYAYSQCVAKYKLSRVELFHPGKKEIANEMYKSLVANCMSNMNLYIEI